MCKGRWFEKSGSPSFRMDEVREALYYGSPAFAAHEYLRTASHR